MSLSAQEAAETRLIVRADDMGSFHSANVASVDCYKNGIETSIELMVVTPWFPEAAVMLRQNPGLDVGLHLVITSEWDNMKWRPLTQCPSLTDENGYFYPMMSANPAYPGQSVSEVKWKLDEIEKEFRAQIELSLKNVPQISHITGHMFSTGFAPEVVALCKRLAAEYNLPAVDNTLASGQYGFAHIGYDGPKKTAAEKEASFISMLNKLEAGKTYMFLDHPAYDNDEMQTVGHVGYEDVAADREGVVRLLTSEKVKQAIKEKGVKLINYNELIKALPRSSFAAEKVDGRAVPKYLEEVKKAGQDLHSLMILRHGRVVSEQWMGEGNAANVPHALHSVSKTFTATAVGFAVAEGRLKVTDKVISFFPDKLPAQVSDNLKALEVRHLLTMSSGHDVEPGNIRNAGGADWVQGFLAAPFVHEPGTFFVYNSLGTYVLSAIVQKVTGEKVIDYLYPRLFRPLGIVGAVWDESPQGINTGGWGLYLKTEDLAKMGQFILSKGLWNGKQLLPQAWFDEATTSHIASLPAGRRPEQVNSRTKEKDWLQGYGYQMWRSRHNSFRADGANGQYILILPEKDAVIVTTANIRDMQDELNLIWKYLLPALK
ncbi:MAG: ChbG/HpnK family deacetylase [Tannerellaceae bacterium]|nr:ChbG/HpnK family deacetylase [Tannerellaceae bacterium]